MHTPLKSFWSTYPPSERTSHALKTNISANKASKLESTVQLFFLTAPSLKVLRGNCLSSCCEIAYCLVLDLRIAHKRCGSGSNFLLNGQLDYPRPDDIDMPLNEAAADNIRDYRPHYNNRPSTSISFMSAIAGTCGRLHCELVRILFLQTHRGAAFYSQLKSLAASTLISMEHLLFPLLRHPLPPLHLVCGGV